MAMSDETDLTPFDFESGDEPAAEPPPLDPSKEFYEGFEPKTLKVEQPQIPISALPSVLVTALEDMQKAEGQPPMYRKGTLSDPLPRMTDPQRMIDFINTTRRLPIEKIEERIVNESMPVMLWKLREFALRGLYTDARAVEIWLNWAHKIQSRPKRPVKDATTASGALFDARLGKEAVIDVTPEKKPGAFSKAGGQIGKIKKPPKET